MKQRIEVLVQMVQVHVHLLKNYMILRINSSIRNVSQMYYAMHKRRSCAAFSYIASQKLLFHTDLALFCARMWGLR